MYHRIYGIQYALRTSFVVGQMNDDRKVRALLLLGFGFEGKSLFFNDNNRKTVLYKNVCHLISKTTIDVFFLLPFLLINAFFGFNFN